MKSLVGVVVLLVFIVFFLLFIIALNFKSEKETNLVYHSAENASFSYQEPSKKNRLVKSQDAENGQSDNGSDSINSFTNDSSQQSDVSKPRSKTAGNNPAGGNGVYDVGSENYGTVPQSLKNDEDKKTKQNTRTPKQMDDDR